MTPIAKAASVVQSSIVTGAQCRMARGLLGWSARELARRAQVSPATIGSIESVDDTPPGLGRTIEKVRRVLAEGGAEFQADGTVRRRPNE